MRTVPLRMKGRLRLCLIALLLGTGSERGGNLLRARAEQVASAVGTCSEQERNRSRARWEPAPSKSGTGRERGRNRFGAKTQSGGNVRFVKVLIHSVLYSGLPIASRALPNICRTDSPTAVQVGKEWVETVKICDKQPRNKPTACRPENSLLHFSTEKRKYSGKRIVNPVKNTFFAKTYL